MRVKDLTKQYDGKTVVTPSALKSRKARSSP